jgi:hypothetical protein
MNKLDASSQIFTLSPASQVEPKTTVGQCTKPSRRLIVLFPASETDSPDLEHRIWEIARTLHSNVLLLSLTSDFEEETQLRRKLVTMAAMIKDPSVATDIMIEHGHDWVSQVRKICQPGDVVACYAGQKTGLMRRPLDQVLRSRLEAPIYILSDSQPSANLKRTFLSRLLFWSGSLAIIGGFFGVEASLAQLPQDWAHNSLIYVCIFLEIALIFLWNILFT